MILCRSNGKFYIGSSKHVEKRFREHRNDLVARRHDNTHLQRAWNQYGEQWFEFVVLERMDASLILREEQWYMNAYRPFDREIGFNISKDVMRSPLGLKRSDETRRRMSLALSGSRHPNFGKQANKAAHEKTMTFVRGMKRPNCGRKSILRLKSPDGSIVDVHGIRGFCRERGFSSGNISLLANGKIQQAYGWTVA
jgi:group I intron endonuclease